MTLGNSKPIPISLSRALTWFVLILLMFYLRKIYLESHKYPISSKYSEEGIQESKVLNKLLPVSVWEATQTNISNNTIIVTICNIGMAKEWLQQWYISARRVGLDNIIVIATSEEAYKWIFDRVGRRVLLLDDFVSQLKSSRWNSKISESEGHEAAFNWRSKGYEQVVTQRATIIRSLMLITKMNILYTDTDIHWLKDPREILKNKFQL